MTDTTSLPNGNGDDSSGAAQPAQGTHPLLAIKAQYVKDLSFENPRAPASLQAVQSPPAVQITVNVSAQRLTESDYEVTLTINAHAKIGEDALFLVELTYGGIVAVGNVAAEHLRPILLIEAPRLLFPFARNIIADATREGGFPPLLIQPVDFVDLYRRDVAQQSQARNA
ncbi:MAG TPA: protein-export chaperone SecB [Alphaproteobacteria bacterium]|nr:protein-export chaperone SecB [Alphaproteobacteria bacterium]